MSEVDETGGDHEEGASTDISALKKRDSSGYIAFAVIIMFLGWALMNTDANLIIILAGPITTALHLSVSQFGIIAAAGPLVGFVMALIFGPLGDKIGRKFIVQLTLVGTAFASVFQYFITSFANWFGIRLAAGAFTASEWGGGATIIAEEVSEKYRSILLSVMQSGWVVGYAFASLISLFALSQFGSANGWRYAFLFAFLPAILVFFLRFRIKNPTRFSHVRAVEDAKKKGDTVKLKQLLDIYDVDTSRVNESSFKQLGSKGLLRTTIVIAAWNFCANGIAITAASYYPIYLENVRGFAFGSVTTLFAVTNFGAITGYILCGFLSRYIGAKYSIMVFEAVAAVGIAFITFFVGHSDSMLYVFYPLYSFANAGQFSALITLNTEAFPTRVRSSGALLGASFWSLGQGVWTLMFGQLIPFLTFNGAWLWLEIVPYSVAVVVFGLAMKNIPPRRALEEIAV